MRYWHEKRHQIDQRSKIESQGINHIINTQRQQAYKTSQPFPTNDAGTTEQPHAKKNKTGQLPHTAQKLTHNGLDLN